MSKLSFSTIPEVPLLLIFDKIALDDLLLNVNLVNRHWNTISEVASQHRRRLVLSLSSRKHRNKPFGLIIDSVYTDPFDVSKYRNRYYGGEHESLIVPYAAKRFNRKSIERLVNRLPKISVLEVNLQDLNILTNKHLDTLINSWREHLVTLKLFTVYSGKGRDFYDGIAKLTKLHTTINSLSVLHHLTYQLDFPTNELFGPFGAINFPISCSSLKELFFSSNFRSDQIMGLLVDAFGDYVLSNEASGLRKVAIRISQFEISYPFEILETPDVLASKTTHIAFDISSTGTFLKMSSKFYNLSHVIYEIYDFFIVDTFTIGLSVLENLVNITIRYKDYDLKNPNKPETQPDSIIPLTRIKSVHLDFENILGHQYFANELYFDLVFPMVELLTIDNLGYNCIPCGGHFSAESKKTTRKSEWHNCIGQFLAPIAKCDKLKRIEYTDDEDFKFCCSLDKFKLDWTDFID